MANLSLKDTLQNALERTKAYIDESVDNKTDKEQIGELSNLQTTNKTNIVSAINELFQSANNGKQLIADAIGNDVVTGDSSFKTMSEAIYAMRSEGADNVSSQEVLYNMMIEDGYDSATSEMTVDELIVLLDESNIDIGDIKQIACGSSYTVILKNDDTVWGCGYNGYGQLGLGTTTTNITTFTKVTTNVNDVKQIACGSEHTVILKNDGTVWSCGNNDYGQLGKGSTTSYSSFTQVASNVKEISCGSEHTFILKNDGTVWSCGRDNYGQLGLNNTSTSIFSSFKQVTTNVNDVKKIICGGNFTFMIKNDGTVWSCGYNAGQLGLGNTTDKTTFTQATTNVSDVKDIVCGGNFTYMLKNDGTIWACGMNTYGQLGLGNEVNHSSFIQVTTNINNDVKEIICSNFNEHIFILKNDGTLWACGNNVYGGRLGLGDTSNRTTFTQVTTNVSNVKKIVCGKYHTFMLKTNDTVWACGYNYNGQLGLGSSGTSYSRSTFTQITINMPNSISDYEINRLKLYYYLLDNEVEVTEDMDIGEMLNVLIDYNINNEINGYYNNLKLVLVDEGVEITEEDDMNSLIVKTDEEFAKRDITAQVSELRNFIVNNGGTITGEEDLNELLEILYTVTGIQFPVEFLYEAKQIECGNEHTFMLKNDGTVWSCGYNNQGQLGLGNNTVQSSFKQVTTNISNVKEILCGARHTIMIKNDGTVWTCGYNEHGQLGLGDTTSRTTFKQATTNVSDVKKIVCGNSHTLMLKNDGTVWGCGYNIYGQLGLGSATNKKAFTQVTTNISDVKDIICGGSHTIMIKNDGTLWGCGSNSTGQLGLGNTTNQESFTQITTNVSDVKDIVCGYQHTFMIKNDGTVWACGYNGNGQLGLGNTTNQTTFTQVTTNVSNVKEIICGSHTYMLKNDGTVWACGMNTYGQLGLGNNTTNQTTFIQVTQNISNVKDIVCGHQHTFMIKSDGTTWSCGNNEYGRLGLGNTTDVNTFTNTNVNIAE